MSHLSWPAILKKTITLLAGVLLVAGCKPSIAPMTAQELKTVTELTKTMQTHCVGRFLIDLPSDADLGSSQGVGYNRDVVIKTVGKMSADAFKTYMTRIETEYKAKKNRRERASYFFGTNKPGTDSQIFERLVDDEGTFDSRLIEGYKWSSGTVFKLTVKAIETSLEKPKDASETRSTGMDVDQRKKYITDLLSKLRSRDVNEIPTEPGLCFDSGFLARKAQGSAELENDEEFSAGVSFKAHPDVSFSLHTYTRQASDSTLLDNKDLDKLIAQNKGHVLRKGSVKLSGISQAEEWLAEGETDDANLVNGKRLRGNYFVLEANSKISDFLTPKLRLTMQTGQSILVDNKNTTEGPTLSDTQALALWDAVSKTLRPRPGAF